jgi:hypothetical protein
MNSLVNTLRRRESIIEASLRTYDTLITKKLMRIKLVKVLVIRVDSRTGQDLALRLERERQFLRMIISFLTLKRCHLIFLTTLR